MRPHPHRTDTEDLLLTAGLQSCCRHMSLANGFCLHAPARTSYTRIPLVLLIVLEPASSALCVGPISMQQQQGGDWLVKPAVSKYYGETLSCTADLRTSACCDPTVLPPRIAAALAKVHPDVTRKYYGCGLCLPPDDLSGLHVLDLGCGAGRDCFILSQLVGASGHVTGIDMTEEQLLASAPASIPMECHLFLHL